MRFKSTVEVMVAILEQLRRIADALEDMPVLMGVQLREDRVESK